MGVLLNQDYTIYLAAGKAYKNSIEGEEITDSLSNLGFAWVGSQNAWSMQSFNFSTTAATAFNIADSTITIKLAGDNSISAGDGTSAIGISTGSNATLNLVNIQNQTATLTVTTSDVSGKTQQAINVSNNGTLNITGITVNAYAGKTTDATEGIDIGINAGTITVTNATVDTSAGNSSYQAYGIKAANSLTVTNSTVTAKSYDTAANQTSIGIWAPTLTVNNGSTVNGISNNANGGGVGVRAITSTSISGGSTITGSATASATGKDATGFYTSGSALTISDNNSKIVGTASGKSSPTGAVCISTDPNVSAQDSSGNRLTWSSTGYTTDGSVKASDVTLSSAYGYALVLYAGEAYSFSDGTETKLDFEKVFGSTLTWDASTSAWTMNNFTFSSSTYRGVTVKADLTINIVGTNTISSANATGGNPHALLANNVNLTLKGSGTLNLNAGYTSGSSNSSYGLYSNSSADTNGCITIDGVTLKVYGNSGLGGAYGIKSANTLTITNGATVTANATNSTSSAATGINATTLSVGGGSTVTATAENTNNGKAYGVVVTDFTIGGNSTAEISSAVAAYNQTSNGLQISGNVTVQDASSKIHATADNNDTTRAWTAKPAAVYSTSEQGRAKVTSDEAGTTELVYDSSKKYYKVSKDATVPAVKAYISSGVPTVSYSLYLASDGTIRKDKSDGTDITAVYKDVLYSTKVVEGAAVSYTWTMNGLNFKTTANYSLQYGAYAMNIVVKGVNSITQESRTDANSSVIYNGNYAADRAFTLSGGGTLTVTGKGTTVGYCYALNLGSTNMNVTDGVTLNVNVGSSAGTSRAINLSEYASLTIDNATVNLTVDNSVGQSSGFYVKNLTLMNDAKLTADVTSKSLAATGGTVVNTMTVEGEDMDDTDGGSTFISDVKCISGGTTVNAVGLDINYALKVYGTKSSVTADTSNSTHSGSKNGATIQNKPSVDATDGAGNTLTWAADGYVDSKKVIAPKVVFGSAGGALNYTLILSSNKAYKNDLSHEIIDLDAEFGGTLTVISASVGSVWVMNGFNFSTSASTAIQTVGDTTIVVNGTNTVTNGTAADVGPYITVQSVTGSLQIKNGTSAGTLTLNNSGATKDVSYGILANSTIGIDGATVTANVTSSVSSVGVKAENLVVTNSAKVTATASGTSSYGLEVAAAIVGDEASVIHATGTTAAYYGGTTEPNVNAYADSSLETPLSYDTTDRVFKNSGVVATDAYIKTKPATSFYVNTSYNGTKYTLTADNHVVGYDAFATLKAAQDEGATKLYITAGGGKLPTAGFNCIETVVEAGASTGSIYGGKVQSRNGFSSSEDATKLTIESGANQIQGVFGGFYKNDSGNVNLTGDMELNIKGGEFTAVVGGADRVTGAGKFTHTGNATLTISGGTFKKQVFGGSYIDNKADTSPLIGNITLNISGGTFEQWIYGGNLMCSNNKASKAGIKGDISISVNTSENDVTFGAASESTVRANLVLGSYGTAWVEDDYDAGATGSGIVTFTGLGEKLHFTGFVLGGASQSYYTTDDDGEITGYEDFFIGSTTIAFDNFNGNFDARIILFENMNVSNGSQVNFTNSRLDLSTINTWDFDKGTAFTNIRGNNFADDTMNFDLTEWDKQDWDVMTAYDADKGFQGWGSNMTVNFIDEDGIHLSSWNETLNGYVSNDSLFKVVVNNENRKMTVSTYSTIA